MLSHERFQPLGLFVLDISLPCFQVRLTAGQELIPPAGERCGGHTQLTRKRFDILAAQKPENRRALTLRRPATPTVPPLFGSPSGRPAGSLRASRSWLSLFVHRHLLVMSPSFSSQFGVQENPSAGDHLQQEIYADYFLSFDPTLFDVV